MVSVSVLNLKSLGPSAKNITRRLFLPVLTPENPLITQLLTRILTQFFKLHLNALNKYDTDCGIHINRVGAGPVETDTEACRWSVHLRRKSGRHGLKNPRAERGASARFSAGISVPSPEGQKEMFNGLRLDPKNVLPHLNCGQAA